MDSGSGSKYLTPCRSFGLKRIHKRTPSAPGSSSGTQAMKSVNSPFTSPLINTRARTDLSVEKKGCLMQDSLWNTPLMNKTCLKMGLSKPSGKPLKKTGRVLQPKDLLSRVTPTKSPWEIWDNALCMTSSRNSSDSGIIPKTSLGKCFEGNHDPVHRSCPSGDALPASEISHERCYIKTVKGSFLGWDSESEEFVSLNSRLSVFKKFIENQRITNSSKSVALSPSSQYFSCYSVIAVAENTSENATAICSSSSDKSLFLPENDVGFCENFEDVTSSVDCDRDSKSVSYHKPEKSRAVSLENHLVCQVKSPNLKFANEDIKRRVYEDSTVFYGGIEDETDDKWNSAPSCGPKLETYSVKRFENGPLSMKKQSALNISRRQMKNRILCGRPTAVMQTITLADNQNPRDRQVTSMLEQDGVDFKSDTEETELRMEIQKWLEGGQRVVQEIIEEVRRQTDREMSVMEVLEEQGVDPDLVGYDPLLEEFVSFDKFMFKNDISL